MAKAALSLALEMALALALALALENDIVARGGVFAKVGAVATTAVPHRARLGPT